MEHLIGLYKSYKKSWAFVAAFACAIGLFSLEFVQFIVAYSSNIVLIQLVLLLAGEIFSTIFAASNSTRHSIVDSVLRKANEKEETQ